MVLSLEMIQAKQGDCLLLHYGNPSSPKIILIDGGPGRHFNTFKNTLKPRLEEIRDELTPDEELPLSLVMVSHMDDDHVAGILKFLEDIDDDREDQKLPLATIDNLWFNSFDDIIGNIEVPSIATIEAGATIAEITDIIPSFSNLDGHRAAVIASTRQGRNMKRLAERLRIPVNHPFVISDNNPSKMICTNVIDDPLQFEEGLSVTVIHPNKKRLERMQKKWDNDLKEARRKGDDSIIFASLSDRDTSPFNLASIVCLVEFESKRILLTGDATDEDILEGLKEMDLLNAEGKIEVDILKIPHHGSDRNVSRNFFEKVMAKHYVISADGRHHNPDKSSLVMLSMATRGRDDFTIHLTNKDGMNNLKEVLDEFIEDDRARGRTYGFEFIEGHNNTSKVIDLLEKIDY